MARSRRPARCRRTHGGSPCTPSTTSSARLGLDRAALADGDLEVRTPITGELLAQRPAHRRGGHGRRGRARRRRPSRRWRDVPAPRRGELVRLLGEELRREKEALGALVTLETGKIAQEGLGEVQEMIDICDLAVGLSRQLFGRTIASERPGHRMLETWHPLGPVAVITRLQLPGRRVELELRARARVRRSRGLEAERAHAAHGARLPVALPARRGGLRRRSRRACSRS